uniref:Uncharacterized protein n=1 Tax=Romanomermis culicivorax TaxID=13658 RepID=A0A915KSF2_ROMCU
MTQQGRIFVFFAFRIQRLFNDDGRRRSVIGRKIFLLSLIKAGGTAFLIAESVTVEKMSSYMLIITLTHQHIMDDGNSLNKVFRQFKGNLSKFSIVKKLFTVRSPANTLFKFKVCLTALIFFFFSDL